MMRILRIPALFLVSLAVAAIAPIRESTVRLPPCDPGIKLPQEFSGGRVEREYLLCGSEPVKHSRNDERARLEAAFFSCVKTPGDGEIPYVVSRDLGKTRIMVILGSSAIGRPVLLFDRRASSP